MASGRDSSSSDEQETSLYTSDGDKRIYHRHSNHQIQKLEAYFKECPHPDDLQQRKLGEELKLKQKQIKFWFQNKRTQAKVQNEKADNASLRTENMKIRRENEAMQEALNTVTCPPCGGPHPGQVDRKLYFQNLRAHNAYLREERDKLSIWVNKTEGHPKPIVNALAYLHGPSLHASTSNNPHVTYGTSSNHLVEPPSLLRELYLREHISIAQPPQPRQLQCSPPLSNMEKVMMTEAMVGAVTEVIILIQTEEPMWIKSSIDSRLVIDQENYEKKFTKNSHFKILSARIESSKEVAVIPLDAKNLVNMLLDTEKWANLFSTIVNKAKTIHVLESSKLMYEQLHILSPLLPPREFMILRCCQQLEEDLWVIADVSYHQVAFEFEFGTPACYKRPSGFLIQAMPNGHSKVTWMEHVEVNDKVRAHRIYRDLLCGGFGYGARRWTATLERMCERLSLYSVPDFPTTDDPGVVKTINGRRRVMDLGERMLKNFAWILNMPEKSEFSQQSATNSSGVNISVRVNKEAGQPPGLIVCACSSLCLPLAPLQVYNFLKNLEVRHQWDVLCHASPVTEVARFVTGANNKNCVNILQPSSAADSGDLMIIQDSFIDALGGMVVYAPVDLNTAHAAVSGNVNPSGIPILPSGFVISRDGRPSATAELGGGRDNCKTLLTVAFQILVTGPTISEELQMDKWTTTVDTLISSTITRVKAMLNCHDGQ
ncbi:PREDICTED: homeobox-leucine zipper protein HDG9-like [Brassica oleracea var. oleracea]|uniref:Homeobox domain-containing protein n=1 Tax=Brassica oleracea var. oleracea TaxID=109376 RepID=A0A0D3CTZ1_BRAOL|nr:PREDICTED: homeobox-leucine zipper protein HDG9-like [Brassica oleracea var. oleracea]